MTGHRSPDRWHNGSCARFAFDKNVTAIQSHGDTATAGRVRNNSATIPGKGWFTILRIYGPLDPWFNKTWKPDDIEPVK